MKKSLILIGLILTVIIACNEEKKTEGTVLAKVNGEVLTLEDLYYQIPSEYRNQLGPSAIAEVVENWINTELLYQKGLAKGLDKDPEILALIKAGTREAIARKVVNDELSANVQVSPSVVDSIYHARAKEYKVEKDKYRASHILLSNKDEADAVYKRLTKGEDFSKLAMDYSIDRGSAERGGDLGYFTADDVDESMLNAISGIKVGSYTKPIQSAYGYHIMKLTDKQAAGAALDSLEAKSQIIDNLYQTEHTRAFQKMLDDLKASASIERFPLVDSAQLGDVENVLP